MCVRACALLPDLTVTQSGERWNFLSIYERHVSVYVCVYLRVCLLSLALCRLSVYVYDKCISVCIRNHAAQGV